MYGVEMKVWNLRVGVSGLGVRGDLGEFDGVETRSMRRSCGSFFPVFFSPLFREQGSKDEVYGSGFRVQGLWFRAQGSGFRVHDSGFRVQGSGFRV